MNTLLQAAALCGGTLSGADARFAGVSTDSRRLRPGDLYFALGGPNFDGHDFVAAAAAAGAAACVVSRDVSVDAPTIRVESVLAALQRFAAGWRAAYRGRLIGVTGSNGKTTVKQMLAAILSRLGPALATEGNLNNHIGVPLTLARLTPSHRYAVIEMGANHLGEIAALCAIARPDIGLVTNAGDAHLEGFGSREGVARGKGEIFDALGSGQVAVINADDAYAAQWAERASPARVLRFGRQAEAEVRLLDEQRAGDGQRFVLRLDGQSHTVQLAVPGRHNALNAAAAAAAALAAGAGASDIVEGLAAFVPAQGRVQRERLSNGALLIDDSYNANPDSMRAAIALLAERPPRRWLVIGDMAELGPQSEALHAAVGRAAAEAGIERLLGCGERAARAVEAFGEGGLVLADHAALVRHLQRHLAAQDSVLIKGSRSAHMDRVAEALRREGVGNAV